MGVEFDGAVLAVIAERAGVAASVLECFEGAVGEAARRKLGQLRGMPVGQRAKEVATVLARVGSPVPPALRAVHGEWVSAALEAEPEAKAAMKEAATSAELSPGVVWTLRRAFGSFPLHAPAAPEIDEARAKLARRGAQALVAVLGGVGGAGGKRAAVAAALAQLGESGEVLKAVVREREGATEMVDAGELAAATRACRGVELRAPHALERIGAAAMKKELEAMTGKEREQWRGMCWFVPRVVGMALAACLG